MSMAAPSALTAPASIMAIALQARGGNETTSVESAKSNKKQSHLNAGRRRLEEFKKKKREKEKENSAVNGIPDVSTRVEHAKGQLPNGIAEQAQITIEDASIQNSKAQRIDEEEEEEEEAVRPVDTGYKYLGTEQAVAVPADDSTVVETFNSTSPDARAPKQAAVLETSSAEASRTHDQSFQLPLSTFRPTTFHRTSFADSAPRKTDAKVKQTFDSFPRPTSTSSAATVSSSSSELLEIVSSKPLTLDEGPKQALDAPQKESVNQNSVQLEGDNRQAPVSNRDDFAALEQHIEDLTQEKFSLQRGLETTRTIVESLTQENATLTEHYNQQGATINELKGEIERYQAEFRAHKSALEKLKNEKDKVQQESTLAAEQARVFASEVISLEEKVLRTRSQELKLQKEMEALREELGASRKHMSSVEKDRSNLKTMIEALQEEKKVLLVRLRDAAKVADSTSVSRADATTSTDDLEQTEQPAQPPADSSVQVTEDVPSTSSLLISLSIPDEQQSIIESINILVSELAQEKTALSEALRRESSAVAELRAENTELSQKLERQTQQLELAVAQNMARGNGGSTSFQPMEPQVEYIDEGDEVVDRVLQWIVKLFPGGSSRRGGSKQL